MGGERHWDSAEYLMLQGAIKKPGVENTEGLGVVQTDMGAPQLSDGLGRTNSGQFEG